jgi:hypothetical protein
MEQMMVDRNGHWWRQMVEWDMAAWWRWQMEIDGGDGRWRQVMADGDK